MGVDEVSVGAITAIKGSVDCGDQTAGTSTVMITGDTAEGALAAAVLDPVRVECDESPDGDEGVASGLMRVGSTKALVNLGLTSDAEVVEQGAVTPAHTLHVEGDLSCGMHAAG